MSPTAAVALLDGYLPGL